MDLNPRKALLLSTLSRETLQKNLLAGGRHLPPSGFLCPLVEED
jgi:hypothetical protein